MAACAFLKPLGRVLRNPLGKLDGAPHRLPRGRHRLPHVEVLHRDAALDHPALQHVQQRIHPELVVRGEADLRRRAVELDGAVGTLEIVALADLLQRLVDRVVDLLEVGAGGHVERGIAGHGRRAG
jgi:hypothetical protein